MGLNVILKLRLRRNGTVNGDTENNMCTEFAMYMYLLSFFFVEIKKVRSSSSGCNAQFYLFNKCGIGPDTHIYQYLRLLFSGGLSTKLELLQDIRKFYG